MKIKWMALLLVLGCLVFMSSATHAQNESGRITGVITDPSNGVIPNATVTITNLDNGRMILVKTGAAGDYTVPFLEPGNYKVSAESAGFENAVHNGLVLSVGAPLTSDFKMVVGNVNTTVNVDESALQINSENAAIETVISPKQVVELPLNGRNFTELIMLGPGAVQPGGGESVNNISIAGARTSSMQFLIDGMSNNDAFQQDPIYNPSIDAIQEFAEQTKNYSAAFGGSANQINISFKSGTNSLHGTAFDFLRNNYLDAKSYFDVKAPPPLKQNQFGYTLGGPIIIPKLYNGKNRSFFFLNYEGLRHRGSSTGYYTVPTAAELGGQFTTPILDPANNYQPFLGNQIPTSRFSRLANVGTKYFPSPNTSTPQGNFVRVSASPFDADQQNYKFDQNIGKNDAAFFRYTMANSTGTSAGINAAQNRFNTTTLNTWQVSETHTFTPNIVNQFRYGRLYETRNTEGNPSSVADIQALQLSNTYAVSAVPRDYQIFPVIYFQNTYNTVGGANAVPNIYQQPLWQLSDSLTIIKGRHSINVGVEMRHLNYYQNSSYQLFGYYAFNGTFTGNTFADFLLGNPYSAQALLPSPFAQDPKQPGSASTIYYSSLAPYLEDDWKVKRNLTINLGVRYDYSALPYEKNNHWAWPDFDFPGGAVWVADKNVFDHNLQGNLYKYSPSRTAGSSQKEVLAPRFGMAWRPFNADQTVLRLGYGIFFDSSEAHEDYATGKIYPYTYTQNRLWATGQPLIYTDQLFSAVNVTTPASTATLGGYETQSPHKKDPYLQDWSVSIQHQLDKVSTVELSYVGNIGLHLVGRANPNEPYPQDPNHITPVTAREPYPNLNLLIMSDWAFHSNYNAMNVKVERSSGDLTLLAAYTWSKSMDDKSAASSLGDSISGWAGPMDSHNYNRDYAKSDYDATHRLVASFIYNLPVGRGKKLLSNLNKPLDTVIGGWQFNGILQLQTGFPFGVGAKDINGDLQTFAQRANLVKNPYSSGFHKSTNLWFSPAAFTQPADGVFGNSSRNILTAPGLDNSDLSITKNVRFGDFVNYQLRVEAFNAFNHPSFGYPNNNIADPKVGVISGVKPGRIVQLGMKLTW